MIKQVMRQGEDKFVRLLNELRWGKVSAASTAALLECQRKHKQPLAPSDGVEMTKLYPYNINVRAENEKHLESLAGELVTFKAEDSIKRVGSGNWGALLSPRRSWGEGSSSEQYILISSLKMLSI